MSEAEDIEFVEETAQVGPDEKVLAKIAQLKQEIQQIQQSIHIMKMLHPTLFALMYHLYSQDLLLLIL